MLLEDNWNKKISGKRKSLNTVIIINFWVFAISYIFMDDLEKNRIQLEFKIKIVKKCVDKGLMREKLWLIRFLKGFLMENANYVGSSPWQPKYVVVKEN